MTCFCFFLFSFHFLFILNNFITTVCRLKKAGDNDSAYAVMQLLESKIPLTLRFLSHSDDDVSATVMDFVKEYVQVMS